MGVCLLTQGTWVQALVQEDPTCMEQRRPNTAKNKYIYLKKKTVEMINETKSSFFEKINKFTNLYLDSSRKKERGTK